MLLVASSQAAQCETESAPHTAALVELYTAEACSACRAAEQWLSGLAQRTPPERIVPFALHVDYGDYTGAKRQVFSRQRKLTLRQRMALVYTPQVLLQGRDYRGWGTNAFDAAAAQINALPARARLRLQIASLGSDALHIRAVAELADAATMRDAGLYLAAYEARARSRVILEWQGPFGFTEPRLALQRTLPLLPKALPSRSGLAGFVQNRRTGEVLQALMLPAC